MAGSRKTHDARFIEPMDCLPVAKIPQGPGWTYEIKLDGYRLEVVRTKGQISLYSRKQNSLNRQFPYIAKALGELPDETIVDGELVALDSDGRPSFNLLQNFRSAESQIIFYPFDLLFLEGRSLLNSPLSERRKLLRTTVEAGPHIALSEVSTSFATMLEFVTEHRLEGIIAKRAESAYEPGRRTGTWSKHKLNSGQEFVVGGYVPSNLGLDSLVVGFYRGADLFYAARVRAGFIPRTRRDVFEKLKHLETSECPFINLPETAAGRWGQGLTKEKMKECRWLRPEAVAQIEFREWTEANHLRHATFVALRDDKDPSKVVRES